MTHRQKGLTVVEMLIVIGILTILSGIVVFAFSNFQHFFELRAATQDVRTALFDARNATLASKGDTVHGVHVDSNQVVRFVGQTYDSASTTNVIYGFPGSVTATSSLTGGGTDIVFTRLTGRAESSGTITVTESRSGTSATVTIQPSGLLGP